MLKITNKIPKGRNISKCSDVLNVSVQPNAIITMNVIVNIDDIECIPR